MKVSFGLTENCSTVAALRGDTPPFPARADVGTTSASRSGSARRERTVFASAHTPSGLQAARNPADCGLWTVDGGRQAACIRVISSSAPFLFSGSLRFPHLGD